MIFENIWINWACSIYCNKSTPQMVESLPFIKKLLLFSSNKHFHFSKIFGQHCSNKYVLLFVVNKPNIVRMSELRNFPRHESISISSCMFCLFRWLNKSDNLTEISPPPPHSKLILVSVLVSVKWNCWCVKCVHVL